MLGQLHTPAETARTFVALRLPMEACLRMYDAGRHVLARAGDGLDGVRVVAPAQMHVTLAFLGELDAGALDVVDGVLDAGAEALVAASRAAAVRPCGARVLGRMRAGAVLLDLEPEARDALEALREQVVDAARDAGAERVDTRPWLPHVTVLRAAAGLRLPRDVVVRVARQLQGVAWHLLSLELVVSELDGDGSHHRVLETWPLRG